MNPATRRRAMVAAIVAVGLFGLAAAACLAVLLLIGHSPNTDQRRVLMWSLLAATVAVMLAPAASRRLHGFATRTMFRDRGGVDDLVRSFSGRMSRSIPLDELLLQTCEALHAAMRLGSAEVWAATGDKLVLRSADPERIAEPLPIGSAGTSAVARAGVSGSAWLEVWMPEVLERRRDMEIRFVPVAHSGELLGALIVERPGPAFTEDEERTLTELARQIGVTLHNAKLDSALQTTLDEVRRQADELQASRGRIVAASDTARREIERNIHDGVQQHLVALAVKIRLIKGLAEKDPAKARELLDQLSSDLDETLQELRDLAHGIYPPLLADKGLAEALRSAANRSVVETTTRTEGIGRYAPEVEATVYFCCLEALQNAAKYAGEGAKALIEVEGGDGALVFSVTDDGAGFDAGDARMGAGFTNMNDRLGAVGGTLRVRSTPGQGTSVSGAIPIAGGGV